MRGSNRGGREGWRGRGRGETFLKGTSMFAWTYVFFYCYDILIGKFAR